DARRAVPRWRPTAKKRGGETGRRAPLPAAGRVLAQSRDPHYGSAPICEGAPQPFGRSVTEPREPPGAQRHLQRKDRHRKAQTTREADALVPTEPVTVEQQCADDRLREIRRQRHAPSSSKWTQHPFAARALPDEKEHA